MKQRHLARVVAVLSCIPGCPGGDAGHVFEMRVRLSPGARPSLASMPYRARRLVKGIEVWSGRLVTEDADWVLLSDDDDDPVWGARFGIVRPGEYLTLYPPGGGLQVFRIVNVDYPADAAGLQALTRDVGAAV